MWWNHIAGWVCTAAYIGIYWLLFQDAGFWWMAVDVIVIDAMGWFVYYAYRRDAIRYAHYLEQLSLEDYGWQNIAETSF